LNDAREGVTPTSIVFTFAPRMAIADGGTITIRSNANIWVASKYVTCTATQTQSGINNKNINIDHVTTKASADQKDLTIGLDDDVVATTPMIITCVLDADSWAAGANPDDATNAGRIANFQLKTSSDVTFTPATLSTSSVPILSSTATHAPTQSPTNAPTHSPTQSPTQSPTHSPTKMMNYFHVETQVTLTGLTTTQFTSSVQDHFQALVATKLEIENAAHITIREVTSVTRRRRLLAAGVNFLFDVAVTYETKANWVSSTITEWMSDDTATGFLSQFNAAIPSSVTVSVVTITSSPSTTLWGTAAPTSAPKSTLDTGLSTAALVLSIIGVVAITLLIFVVTVVMVLICCQMKKTNLTQHHNRKLLTKIESSRSIEALKGEGANPPEPPRDLE
jgi:hypothetical protein